MSSFHMPECNGLIQCEHDKWHNLKEEELNFIRLERAWDSLHLCQHIHRG